MLFDVRVIAFDPRAPEDPVDALVRVFKLERGKAKELVHTLPRVIKRGAAIEQAQRLSALLEQLGARTEIVMAAVAPDDEVSRATMLNEPSRIATLPTEPTPTPTQTRATVTHTPTRTKPAQETAHAPRTVAQRSSNIVQPKPGAPLPPPNPAMLSPLLSGQAAPANANAMRASRAGGANAGVPRPGSGNATARQAAAATEFALPALSAASAPRAQAVAPGLPAPALARRPALPREEPNEDDSLEADIGVPSSSGERAAHPSGHRPGAAAVRSGQPFADEGSRIRRAHPVAEEVATLRPPPGTHVLRAEATRPSLRATVAEGTSPFADAHASASNANPTLIEARPDVVTRSVRPASPAVPLAVSPPRTSASADAAFALPVLSVFGPPVAADEHRMPETRSIVLVTSIVTVIACVFLALLTMGVAVAWLAFLALRDVWRRFCHARRLQTSAIPVGQSQLPELYACVKQFAVRLGFAEVSRTYVGRTSSGDVCAMTCGREILLMIDGQRLAEHVRHGTTHVVTFAIAHELARFTLGQQRLLRRMLAACWPVVRKTDLLSADAVAVQLMSDRELSESALVAMLGGGEMATLVSRVELERQAASHERDGLLFGTRAPSGYDMLLSRLHHMQQRYARRSQA